ncbi:MAG: hypothetical protein AB1664_08095 [Thermodesulfobacteriota bacterium]
MAFALQALESLREEGYYPFVAIFRWTYHEDQMMKEKLGLGMDYYFGEEIHRDYTTSYYCTGARTIVVTGFTKSNLALQRYSAAFILDTPIEANFYHAVDVKELLQCLPK